MKKYKKLFNNINSERLKKIIRIYEDIIINPVLITIIVFILTFIFVVTLTLHFNFYSMRFFENVLVEAHGVIFDIFMLGVVILWLQQKGKNKVEKKRYQDEIDDFRGWNSEEASRRIRGNIRRLNSFGVTSIDISNCFLKSMDLRYTNLTGCYAWGADLSWTDMRFSSLVRGNFEDANFAFANLSGTEIKDAYFWKANMSNCNIRNSNLTNCVMLETDLSDSDFTESAISNSSFANSNLSNTIFWDADLTNVDFDSANLDNADFQNADLRDAIGLDNESILKAFSFYNAKMSEKLQDYILFNCPELLNPPENRKGTDF